MLPPSLLQVLQALPAWVVGGWLRDRLRGRESRDLDLVLEAGDPLEVAAGLARTFDGVLVPLDRARRIVRVVLPDLDLQVDLSPPQGGSLEEDLWRRDFTLNALALPAAHLNPRRVPLDALFDPTGGLEDLRRGRLRLPRPDAFLRDPGRLWRTVRFRASLGAAVLPETRRRLRHALPFLPRVAPERIQQELRHLFTADVPVAPHLAWAWRVGLLPATFPELAPLPHLPLHPAHRWPADRHSLEALRAVEALLGGALGPRPPLPEGVRAALDRLQTPRDRAVLRLAALLHDVGKGVTLGWKGTTPTFYGHDRAGARLLRRRLRALRLPGWWAGPVVRLTGLHMQPLHLLRRPPTLRALRRLARRAGPYLPHLCALFLADRLAHRGIEATLGTAEWIAAVDLADRLLAVWAREQTPPLLQGRDLRRLGLPPGPRIGRLLEEVRRLQLEGRLRTREEALAWVRRRLGREEEPRG